MGKYEKASPRQRKGISASTWNHLVSSSKHLTGTSMPSGAAAILSGSTIVPAKHSSETKNIPPWTPVIVTGQQNYNSDLLEQPTYDIVEISERPNTDYSYGFTLSEGISEGYGLIVVSGAAIVRLKRKWFLDDSISGNLNDEESDVWLNIPDGSIIPNAVTPLEQNYDSLNWVGPVGQFKIVGQKSLNPRTTRLQTQAGLEDYVYAVVDMNQRPGRIGVRVATTVGRGYGAAVNTSDQYNAGEAFVIRQKAFGANDFDEVHLEEEDSTLVVRVVNPYQVDYPPGLYTATYSTMFNRFMLDPDGTKLYEGTALESIGSSVSGSVQLSEGVPANVFNVTASLSPIFGTSAAVSPGKSVLVMKADRGYVIVGAECESTEPPTSSILVDNSNTGTPTVATDLGYDAVIQTDGTYVLNGSGSWELQAPAP